MSKMVNRTKPKYEDKRKVLVTQSPLSLKVDVRRGKEETKTPERMLKQREN